jgi:hypothetical protein
MKKLYVVTDKKGNPQSFGRYAKSSWTSPRWVAYHIGPKRWNPAGKSDLVNVHEIDFENNSMTKISGTSFMASRINPEKMKQEIKLALGIAVDLSTLEHLIAANALTPELNVLAKSFLSSKGC